MKLSTPTINKIALAAADMAALEPEARLEQTSLSGEGAGLYAPNASIDESVLDRVLLIEAKLEKFGLRDVEAKGCDFSAARCSEGSLSSRAL